VNIEVNKQYLLARKEIRTKAKESALHCSSTVMATTFSELVEIFMGLVKDQPSLMLLYKVQ